MTCEHKNCVHYRSKECQIVKAAPIMSCSRKDCLWNNDGCTQCDGFRNPEKPEICNEYKEKCPTLKGKYIRKIMHDAI